MTAMHHDPQAVLRALPREFHSLQRDEQRVSLQLYRLLAEGEPVSRSRIAETLGLPEASVNTILEQWPGVYFNEEGEVIGYWGLALPDMGHRFEVEGRLLYTWCAWDSLFIPELIRKTATVTSACPVTGETIRLTVDPGGIRTVHPAGTVMSFLTPPDESFREDVINQFCHYIHFFSSAEAGAQWCAGHQGTFLLPLDRAMELGRIKNRAQYPDLECVETECRA